MVAQTELAIGDADAILFLVDVRSGHLRDEYAVGRNGSEVRIVRERDLQRYSQCG